MGYEQGRRTPALCEGVEDGGVAAADGVDGWYLGLALAIAGAVLLIRKLVSDRDPFFRLLGCSLLGAAIFIALFDDYSALREELVFIPR